MAGPSCLGGVVVPSRPGGRLAPDRQSSRPELGRFQRQYVTVRESLTRQALEFPTATIILRQTLYASAIGVALFVVYFLFTSSREEPQDTEPAVPQLLPPAVVAPRSTELSATAEAIGQVVPAIVIAVFVFGVGTAFVVAQVVPPARGTRAVDFLQGRRFNLTIVPALALVAGSALLLALENDDTIERESLALTLLAGSVAYVLASTASLLSIYRDATDPRAFRRLILKKQRPRTSTRARESVETALVVSLDYPFRVVEGVVLDRRARVAADSDGGREGSATRAQGGGTGDTGTGIRELHAKRAAERLYRLVRTARGWARVAANSGDSRELHEALSCIIDLVTDFSTPPFGVKRAGGRSTYGAAEPTSFQLHLNPRGALWTVTDDSCDGGVNKDHDCSTTRKQYLAWANSESSIDSWFANEVGRALVRAAEYGLRTGSLLDRDLLRILNTMVLCLEQFVDLRHGSRTSDRQEEPDRPDDATEVRTLAAGVMIRYLTEIGMAVRWCPAEQLEWFHAPAIHLARLSSRLKRSRELSLGCVAGLVLVVDSILWREDQDDAPPDCQAAHVPGEGSRAQSPINDADQKSATPLADRSTVIGAVLSAHGTVADLSRGGQHGEASGVADVTEVVCLGRSSILRPEERPIAHEADDGRLREILDALPRAGDAPKGHGPRGAPSTELRHRS
jgi:hypothetical protein